MSSQGGQMHRTPSMPGCTHYYYFFALCLYLYIMSSVVRQELYCKGTVFLVFIIISDQKLSDFLCFRLDLLNIFILAVPQNHCISKGKRVFLVLQQKTRTSV